VVIDNPADPIAEGLFTSERAEALKRADALNVFLYGPGSGAQPTAAGDLLLLGALSTLDKEPTP
jgi:hypothetical protein